METEGIPWARLRQIELSEVSGASGILAGPVWSLKSLSKAFRCGQVVSTGIRGRYGAMLATPKIFGEASKIRRTEDSRALNHVTMPPSGDWPLPRRPAGAIAPCPGAVVPPEPGSPAALYIPAVRAGRALEIHVRRM